MFYLLICPMIFCNRCNKWIVKIIMNRRKKLNIIIVHLQKPYWTTQTVYRIDVAKWWDYIIGIDYKRNRFSFRPILFSVEIVYQGLNNIVTMTHFGKYIVSDHNNIGCRIVVIVVGEPRSLSSTTTLALAGESLIITRICDIRYHCINATFYVIGRKYNDDL